MKGSILFFDPAKGFGFVRAEIEAEGLILTEDIFLHRSAMPDPWRHRKIQDQPCEFDLAEFKGRRTAANVRLVQVGAPSEQVLR